MMNHCLRLASALAFAVLPWGAMAQASAPTPTAPASAPAAGKPSPVPLTPQQARESATAPGDLRPEHAAVPQVTIPLGKKPAVPVKPPSKAARRGDTEPIGGIDDAVARCEAQSDRQVRADCRAKLAIEGRKR